MPAASTITAPPPITRVRAWFAGKSRAVQRTVPYGERAVVEGTLTDAGGRAGRERGGLRVRAGDRGGQRSGVCAADGREGTVLVSARGRPEPGGGVLEWGGVRAGVTL